MRSSIVIVVWCLLASCKDNVKTTVTGWWTIDTLIYQGYEMRTCLLLNSIEFNNDGTIKLPVPEAYCSELVTEYNQSGNWNILRSDSIPLLLMVESDNVIFSGTHQIVFRRDEQNKLLKMDLSSDSLYVVCRKGMFSYERNQELINELVRISEGE